MKQLYNEVFKDYKFANCIELFSYVQLVNNFKSVDSLKKLIMGMKYKSLFKILFMFNNKSLFKDLLVAYPLNLDDIPVTENYKEKHPKPLFDEFNIKKDDYDTNKKYDNNLETVTWLHFYYEYSVGVDEEEKKVNIVETKNVELLFEEDGDLRSRVVFDEKGNEMTENSKDTRKFTFKYVLDKNGYVDDIEFVNEIKLVDDKYLDHLWENVKG